MIGSIIKAKCQDILEQVPIITIDTDTRLAFSVEATEAEFNQVVVALPQGAVLFESPSINEDDGRLYVEIIPHSPRDLEAEIDKIKAEIEKLKEAK